jgi:hypothetical protein
LKTCLLDEQPATRQMAAMPLAWTRHPEATAALIEGYSQEPESEVKARLLFTAVQLMSPAGEKLLQEALASPDAELRGIAEHLQRTHTT